MDKLNFTGESIVYENQEKIASDVVETFANNEILNVMVVSRTQSGKTGAMCATIK
jgi:dUTPase